MFSEPFTCYLILLLLPEVKRLLSVDEKMLHVLAAFGSLMITCTVVPPLPVILADDVSQKVWPSLISTKYGGAYPQNLSSFLALRGKCTKLL